MKIYMISYVAADKSWRERVEKNKVTPEQAAPFIEYVNATPTGTYRVGGWEYNFRDELRLFLVKEKYSGWREYYATNKTAIRKKLGSHNIIRIVELEK